MFRIRRVPALPDRFFDPLRSHVHWNPWMDVRLLVVAMACMWGRRHVAHRYRDLDAEPHRTHFHNFCLVARWDPEAALRQKAQAWLRALRPGPGATLDWSLEDAKQATRGQAIDASATRQDPTTAAASRGHPEVGALLVCRDHVLPVGIRLEVTQGPCAALGRPVRTTPELGGATHPGGQVPHGGHGRGRVRCLLSVSHGRAGRPRAAVSFGLDAAADSAPLPARVDAPRRPRWTPAVSAAPHRPPGPREARRADPLARRGGWRAGGQQPWPAARDLLTPRPGPKDPRAGHRHPGALGHGRHPAV